MAEELNDELRAKLAPGFADLPTPGSGDDLKECAYIGLSGAVERLSLVLQYRSERNYDVAVAAVVRAHVEYLKVVSGVGQSSPAAVTTD